MSNGYKYPYIPKEYYPAVMYACSMIRKYGTFNVAINTAAKRYGVDADEVAKHVRKRQGAGQKGKTRKYHYYGCLWFEDYIYGDEGYFDSYNIHSVEEAKPFFKYRVVKATNEENAKSHICKMLGYKAFTNSIFPRFLLTQEVKNERANCPITFERAINILENDIGRKLIRAKETTT